MVETEGGQQDVQFSRPNVLKYEISLELISDRELSDAEKDRIRQSILAYTHEHILLGDQIYPSRFYAPIFKTGHVVDIKMLEISCPGHRGPIKPDQYAEFTAPRISIKDSHEVS